MKNNYLSSKELQEWEALQIKGGASNNENGIMAQDGCTNSTAGCGGGANQKQCTNTALGCGADLLITCAAHKTTAC